MLIKQKNIKKKNSKQSQNRMVNKKKNIYNWKKDKRINS